MLRMDQVHVIRHKVLVEGHSERSVARELRISRNTVRKYLTMAEPHGWRTNRVRGPCSSGWQSGSRRCCRRGERRL